MISLLVLLLFLRPSDVFGESRNFTGRLANRYIETSYLCFEYKKCLDQAKKNQIYALSFNARRAICRYYSLTERDWYNIYYKKNDKAHTLDEKAIFWVSTIMTKGKHPKLTPPEVYEENKYYPTGLSHNPVIMWTLSNRDKGRNVGTSGTTMDLDTSPCRFFPDQLAPDFDETGLLYCKIEQGKTQVSLYTADKKLVFDFFKPFSIAMWIKSMRGPALLVGGHHQLGPRFMAWPAREMDQFALALGDGIDMTAVSDGDDNSRTEWRHIAVSYEPPLKVKFFVNGVDLPVLKKMKSISKKHAPQSLQIWRTEDDHMQFFGIMACVTFFQGTVPLIDLKRHKDFCPKETGRSFQ